MLAPSLKKLGLLPDRWKWILSLAIHRHRDELNEWSAEARRYAGALDHMAKHDSKKNAIQSIAV